MDRLRGVHGILLVNKRAPAVCEAVVRAGIYKGLWMRLLQLLQEEYERGSKVGLDISTGEPLDPQMAGIFDNYLVKKQVIQSAPVIASQLLLVDEVMRAGVGMRGK